MGRIRTIKPEFPQSQSMGKVSRDARLLFVLLWTVADDSGRTRAASRMLASLLYPYDDDAPKLIERWLKELENVDSIVRYVVDGDDYLEICKWSIHQKIDKPSKSKFPAPSNPLEPSSTPRESSALDQGPRTRDQGEDQGPVASRGALAETSSKPEKVSRPDDVPEDLWQEWVAFRKSKRATVTKLVLDTTRAKATEAGMTMVEALTFWIANGQTGFFPKPKAKTKATGNPIDGGFDQWGKWHGVGRGPKNYSAPMDEDDPEHPKSILANQNSIRASKGLPPLPEDEAQKILNGAR